MPTGGRPPLSLRGVGGRSRKAKTVRAVRLTAQDMLTSLPGTSTPRFGGLRGGYATASLRPARVRLVGYQYVPGVKVSGLLTPQARPPGRHAHRVRRPLGAGQREGHALGQVQRELHAAAARSVAASSAGEPLRLPAAAAAPGGAGAAAGALR